MKDQLQAELKHRYPKLMRVPGLRYFVADDTAPEAAELVSNFGPIDERGIECGDGWFDLVNRLSAACEKEIDTMAAAGTAMEYWPRAVQIKEKFGTLRFRVHGKLSEALRTEILKAEEVDSAHICEQCGAPGHLRSDSFRRTWCDACEAAYD
jgi:hypothetical protein